MKSSINDCEVMAGIQYALYESYAILILEQIREGRNNSADKMKEVIEDVKWYQKKALKEWMSINSTLAIMVEKEYHMDLFAYQLSGLSFSETEQYANLVDGFREKIYLIQRMIANDDLDLIEDVTKSLSDYIPKNSNNFALNIFISKKGGKE